MSYSESNLISRTHSEVGPEIFHNAVFSNELHRLNMNVYEMCYSVLDNTWHSSDATASYNRIYFVCSGSAEIFCGGKRTVLSPGNIYIVPAHSKYAYHCHNRLEKFYFHLNIMRCDNYDIFSSVKECIVLENHQSEINFLLDRWKGDDLFSVLQVKSILYSAVCEGIKNINSSIGKINLYSPVVKKILDYINENLNVKLKIHNIADHLFVSKSYISKCFKSEMGISVKNYISERILSEAAILLRHSGMSIKEISDSFGFCDQFYFSRVFSLRYGMPPQAYRKLNII